MAAKRFSSDQRLADVLTLRISSKIRATLERTSDEEKISIAMAARNAIEEGLKAKTSRDTIEV